MQESYKIFLQLEVSLAPEQEKGQPKCIHPRIHGRRGFLEGDKIRIKLKARNDSKIQFPGGYIQLRIDFISQQKVWLRFTIPPLQSEQDKNCFGPSGTYDYAETDVLYSGYALLSVQECRLNDGSQMNLRGKDGNIQVGKDIAMHSIYASNMEAYLSRWALIVSFLALLVSIFINTWTLMRVLNI